MSRFNKRHLKMKAEPGIVTLTGHEIEMQIQAAQEAQAKIRTFRARATILAKTPTVTANGEVVRRGRLASATPAVPQVGELLIGLLASKKQRDAILGDAEEQFHANLKKGYSLRRAQLLYWINLRDLVWPSLKRWGGRLFYIALGWASARWGRPN